MVTEPWVRPAFAGQSTTAFMELMSTSGGKLIDVDCALAGSLALRAANGQLLTPLELSLPAGSVVRFTPKAYRLELRAVTRTLRVGDRLPLGLTVRNPDGSTQAIPVDAEVRRRSPSDDHRIPHTHH